MSAEGPTSHRPPPAEPQDDDIRAAYRNLEARAWQVDGQAVFRSVTNEPASVRPRPSSSRVPLLAGASALLATLGIAALVLTGLIGGGDSLVAIDAAGDGATSDDRHDLADGTGTADGEAGESLSLADVTWTLASGAPLVDGFPITLSFFPNEAGDETNDPASGDIVGDDIVGDDTAGDDTAGDDTALGGSVEGRFACNSYGSQWEHLGDTSLPPDVEPYRSESVVNARWMAGPMSFTFFDSTGMTCQPDVMESETQFLAALREVNSFLMIEEVHEPGASTLRLILRGPDPELVFVPEAPLDTEAVIDQLWILEWFSDGEEFRPVANDAAFIRIRSDGTVEGGTGCRSLAGTWIEANGQILFNNLTADGACSTDLQRQDNQVVTVLGDGFTATVDRDQMTAWSVGHERLGFRRATAGESPTEAEPVTQGIDFAYDPSLTWSVVLVASDDVLNVRGDPGADSPIVGELAPDATGLIVGEETVNVGGATWRRIHAPDMRSGWVNDHFVAARPASDGGIIWGDLESAVRQWIEDGTPPASLKADPEVLVGGIGVYADFPFPPTPVRWAQWNRPVDFTPDEMIQAGDSCRECVISPAEFIQLPTPERAYDLVRDADLTVSDAGESLGASFQNGPVGDLNGMAHLTIEVAGDPENVTDWQRIHLFFDWRSGEPSLRAIYTWGWTP